MRKGLSVGLLALLALCFCLAKARKTRTRRSTESSVAWSEEINLAPTPPPVAEGLPLCDYESSHNGVCLERSPRPMGWEGAHSYCRGKNGFLPSRDQHLYLKLHWPEDLRNKNDHVTWTALTPYMGFYQWLGRSPYDTPANSDFVSWKKPPEPWSRECAALDVTVDEFQLTNCSLELHFYCALDKSESAEGSIDFSDFELQVSSSIGDVEGFIKVSEKNFNDLLLNCTAIRKSTGEILPIQPAVFWRKDNVYIGYSSTGLLPSSFHDSSKASEQANVNLLNQGKYWCEAWRPFSNERSESNKVVVALKEWVTIIFDVQRYEDVGDGRKHVQDVLMGATLRKFHNISNIWDPVLTEKTFINKSRSLLRYIFHAHYWKDGLDWNYIRTFNLLEKCKEDLQSKNFLNTSSVTFATICYKQKKYSIGGKKLNWPLTEAGYVYPKHKRCKVKYGKFSPGICKADYIRGAYISFDPLPCEWVDRCPQGYINLENEYCMAISPSDSWSNGFKNTYKTSQEESIVDNTGLLSKKYLQSVKNSTLRESGGSVIWLPVKREQGHGPLVFKGPIGWEHMRYKEFGIFGISWLEGHPRSDQNCLTLDLKTMRLQTSDCNAKHPFVSVINRRIQKKRFSQWGTLTKASPQCTAPDREDCLCPNGWNTTVFKGTNETCFQLFPGTDSLTWPEAQKFCADKGARLPSPNIGFLDWVYRQLLHNNNVSSVWMDIRQIPDRIIYNDSVDYINWLPETDYSLSYGSLTTSGWLLESESETKQNVLCQQITLPQVTMNLRVNEPKNNGSQTMCIDVNPLQLLADEKEENVRCYFNGVMLAHERTKDSGCQYEMKVNGQGYYQCQAWARPPFMLTESNTILHRDSETLTYVVTLFENKTYSPQFHDATFKNEVEHGRARNSKSCVDMFGSYLQISHLARDFRFSYTQSFYLPESNGTQLLHNFHLESERINGADTSEPELLRDLLDETTNMKQIGDCTFMRIRSTVGCSSSFDKSRNLTWPWTVGNEFVLPEELCITPEGIPVMRECLGDFIEGYYWAEPSGNCTGIPSGVTTGLWELLKSRTNGTVTSRLAELTSNKSLLLPVDIHFVAKTFQTLSQEEVSTFDLDDIVSTLSNVMGVNTAAFIEIQEKLNSSSILLEAFEELTFRVQLLEGDYKKSIEDLVTVERLDLKANTTVIGYKSHSGSAETLLMGFKEEDIADAEAAIILPNNLTYSVSTRSAREARNMAAAYETVPVVFAVFQNEKLFQDNISFASYSVNSPVITATYKQENIRDLEDHVKILFKPRKAGNDTKCVYWDSTKNNKHGGWSEEGCKDGGRQGMHDVCYCNHLTSFAQLINYDDDSGFLDNHALALDVITIIGCCLSIMGLLLVFVTFCLFKKWRRSLGNKILVNLSLSIFCSMVIFLAGINQTWNDQLCRSVAVGLHYFILASFGWMLVEAVHQYLKFVKVVGTYIPRFLWKASVCAWGIPVLPILIVLIYDHSLYDSNNDYNEDSKICWMSVEGFKYAFLPPLAMTMTVNLIMYSLIIHGAICARARVNSTMPERTLFMNQLRMAVCVFFLLGFTWIFGLLAVSKLRHVFSYLFCIFNTLQGFFIFLFHVCREHGARKYWRDFLSVLTKDPVSSTPGNSFNPINSHHFRGHPDSVSFDNCGGILIIPQGPLLRPHHLRRGTRSSILSARTNSTLVQSRTSFHP